jgi:hypothetical protein
MTIRNNAFQKLNEYSRLVARAENIERRYRQFRRNNPEPNQRTNYAKWSRWYSQQYAIIEPIDEIRKAMKRLARGFLFAWGVPSLGNRHQNANRARQVHDMIQMIQALKNKNTYMGRLKNRNIDAWKIIVEQVLRTKYPR